MIASGFSLSAAVGHDSTQAPHETHSESRNGSSWLATTRDSKPRPSIVSANVPWTSSQARTQREQAMQSDGSNWKYGLLSSQGAAWWFAPSKPYGLVVTPRSAATLCSSQCVSAGQPLQLSGWSET